MHSRDYVRQVVKQQNERMRALQARGWLVQVKRPRISKDKDNKTVQTDHSMLSEDAASARPNIDAPQFTSQARQGSGGTDGVQPCVSGDIRGALLSRAAMQPWRAGQRRLRTP